MQNKGATLATGSWPIGPRHAPTPLFQALFTRDQQSPKSTEKVNPPISIVSLVKKTEEKKILIYVLEFLSQFESGYNFSKDVSSKILMNDKNCRLNF